MRFKILRLSILLSYVAMMGVTNAETIKSPIVGVWKVSSISVQLNPQQVIKPLGEHPSGYVTFTRGGHTTAVLIAGGRSMPGTPPTDAEAAVLYRALNAYDGSYKISGKSQFTVHVEDAWTPSWTGNDQQREFKITGRRLTVTSRSKSPSTGQEVVVTVISDRLE